MATLSKICKFIYCHPAPEQFIRAIVGKDDNIFKHLLDRWISYKKTFGSEGAMVRFVGSLDAELTGKMDAFAEKWIENNC